MTNLACDVIHCISNCQNRCCRPEIQVNGNHAQDCCETCCASFRQTVGGEAANSVDYRYPNEQMPIACTAETCRYNREGVCEAKEIQVTGREATHPSQTECATFEAKH